MKRKIRLKPQLEKRMKLLLKEDYENFLQIIKKPSPKYIRVNEIKISSEELKKRLKNKGWNLTFPVPDYKEIISINSELNPGELGKSQEHLLGYFYIQDLASMLPVLSLNLSPMETFLDLAAAPGSKTTQASGKMKNSGIIIANDKSLGRLKILSANLERTGASNVLITRETGEILCKKLEKQKMKFDKILIDAPCSGEGTLRNKVKTSIMWNINNVKFLSTIQKKLLSSAIPLLKPEGKIVYSTCTHSPEENEEVVSEILTKFPKLKLEKIELPIKTRKGIKSWQGKTYHKEINKTARIYPHDNNTEGFFLAKLKLK